MNPRRNKYFKDIAEIRKDLVRHFQPHLLDDLLKLEKMENPHPLFSKMEALIERNVRGISTTQLRKLFDIVKNASNRRALLIQRPQFAHMIAKQPDESAKYIMLLVDEVAACAGQDDVLFQGFPFFLESLVAFHKYYEVLNRRRLQPNKIKASVRNAFKNLPIGDLLKLESAKNPDVIIDQLQSFIKANVTGITATQLRNIYGKILNNGAKNKLPQLQPVLFYTAARQEREESQRLIYFITTLIRALKGAQDKKAFLKIMEILLSIHKFEEFTRNKRIDTNKLTQEIKGQFKSAWNKLLKETDRSFAEIQEALQSFVLFRRGEGIKSAQFRRLYDEVMRTNKVNELKYLRPLFLYTFARQQNPQSRKIIYFFVLLLKEVQSAAQLETFKILMEDLLAYHRFFEETNTQNIIKLKI